MKSYRIRICPVANLEHKISKRQYAHTYHYPNVICVAEDFLDLPDEHYYGILYHEIGHLLAGPEGGEKDADRAVLKTMGIKIKYKDSKYGDNLEYIDL